MSERIKKFPIGGTHLPEEKGLTSDAPIVTMPAPAEVLIPLKQHLGVVLEPMVAVGDRVRRGSLLGDTEDGLRAKIHSSVVGEVTEITDAALPDGSRVRAVRIRTDESDVSNDPENEERLSPLELESLSDEQYRDAVIARVEEAGIVGLGGATFPTHIKLATKDKIDTVIV
ncbi:MAG: electron transport complex subunit RsxC, partial [Spirochaetaceae bacterium]